MPKDNHKILAQRMIDHEKLCMIMQKQTQNQIAGIKKQIARLEKVVVSSAAFIIIGLFMVVLALLKNHF